MSSNGRIAVTGIGVVSALGHNQNEHWSAILEGRCGIRHLDLFDPDGCLSSIAGQADPPPGSLPCSPTDRLPAARRRLRSRRRRSRSDSFCLAAAAEALRQAGLTEEPALARFGLSLGCTTAGMLEAEDAYAAVRRGGWGRARIAPMLRVPMNTPADMLASCLGLEGPRLSNMTACASASLAIGLAADRLRDGDAEGMIAGGGDALCRLTYSGFSSLRLLDPHPCRPFDLGRGGLSLGEGAGILVLEPWERATRRGARPLAEFLDYGATCDAHHMTSSPADGRGALAAMREALERAGIGTKDVGYVNAHGTGTAGNDSAEVQALLALFGEDAARVPVSSTKSMVGHVLGGAGGVEAVTTVLALQHQVAPPTLGVRTPEGGGRLDFVPERGRPAAIRAALSNSFGFGGANVCLVFRAAAES